MFKYGINGKQAPAGEKQNKQIVQHRKVTYIHFSEEKKENYEIVGMEPVLELTFPPDFPAEQITNVCVDSKVLDYSKEEREVWERKQRSLFRRKD